MSQDDKCCCNHSSLGILDIFVALFMGLKISGVTDMSWFYVFLPWIAHFGVTLVILLVSAVVDKVKE